MAAPATAPAPTSNRGSREEEEEEEEEEEGTAEAPARSPDSSTVKAFTYNFMIKTIIYTNFIIFWSGNFYMGSNAKKLYQLQV